MRIDSDLPMSENKVRQEKPDFSSNMKSDYHDN